MLYDFTRMSGRYRIIDAHGKEHEYVTILDTESGCMQKLVPELDTRDSEVPREIIRVPAPVSVTRLPD